MEDTLRDVVPQENYVRVSLVLILVLMEDTLRDMEKLKMRYDYKVLILVLMEDTLRAKP